MFRRGTALAVILTLSLVLVACGGSSGEVTGDEASETSAPAPTATATATLAGATSTPTPATPRAVGPTPTPDHWADPISLVPRCKGEAWECRDLPQPPLLVGAELVSRLNAAIQESGVWFQALSVWNDECGGGRQFLNEFGFTRFDDGAASVLLNGSNGYMVSVREGSDWHLWWKQQGDWNTGGPYVKTDLRTDEFLYHQHPALIDPASMLTNALPYPVEVWWPPYDHYEYEYIGTSGHVDFAYEHPEAITGATGASLTVSMAASPWDYGIQEYTMDWRFTGRSDGEARSLGDGCDHLRIEVTDIRYEVPFSYEDWLTAYNAAS